MKRNYDIGPQRDIAYISPVDAPPPNGGSARPPGGVEAPPLLKYDGHRDDLIKVFVLRDYKLTPGMRGSKSSFQKLPLPCTASTSP
jgi:hypothetical protein